jgi:hypothetical protein
MASESNKVKEDEQGKTVFIDNTEPNRPLSRYNGIRLLLNANRIPVQETWEMDEIEENEGDSYFEVTAEYAHRPDLISLLFYGTEQFYWVIAFANKLMEPFAQTIVGLRLRIPDRETVFQTILVQQNARTI